MQSDRERAILQSILGALFELCEERGWHKQAAEYRAHLAASEKPPAGEKAN
jgi:hypothetical protein